ncbi:hypothetical protein LCGC14_2775540, partial [marine sediment metagenome]
MNIEDLYTSYWSELCKFLHSRYGSGPPEPEDIAQTAFVKFASLENNDRVENPRAFIYRTASNLIVDYHRSPR